MRLKPIHAATLCTLLAASVHMGCDTTESPPPRDENGKIIVPAGIRESQHQQRTKFLEQEKKNRLGGRR